MPGIGSALLVVAFGAAIYCAIASVYGARTNRRQWVVSGRRAIYCVAGLVVASMVLLEIAYLRSDFQFALVAQNSSTDTPTFYKLTAVWSSQAGSLLLWVTLLALFSSAVLFATRHRHREIAPYAAAVLGGVAAFFLFLMLFYASPFDALSPVPVEGNGLNPLLRHPAMMIHPPMLYSGYVGFSIPFAFAIGALITRRTDASWIRSTRRFALIAWTFLGVGVLLGALWSYSELGWGGYWAWDAVENAALLPWLTGTAFIHSIQIQEKRGMLKVWNVSLIVATFLLALLGTFLVRSGILDSIHAFGASTLGKPFLAFIAIAAVGSIGLVVARLPYLRSDARLDSFLSREAFFLANNLVLVGLAFVVFWGTFFPLISEAVTGREQSVGPPWFDRYTVPLALVLVLLTGIGPALTWRRSSPSSLKRTFAIPLAAVVLGALVLIAFTPAEDSVLSLVMFVLAVFTLTVAGQELWRGAGARRVTSDDGFVLSFVNVVRRNRRRYGGYLVHVGIAILFVGVAASSAFVSKTDARLSPGQSTEVGGYKVTYERATAAVGDDASGTGAPIALGAVLNVERGGKEFTVRPQRNYFPSQDVAQDGAIGRFFEGEATSEVDVRWGPIRDFWLAVQPDIRALDKPIAEANRRFTDSSGDIQALVIAAIADVYRREAPPATFRTLVSPLVIWIWLGGGISVLGALLALWPGAGTSRARSIAAARVGRELSRA
ncbi:MAG: heme lyase CcmF/NrfE family subunit [Thermoleophilaceae bacterium]|nr:heme lyase CcmF/NrfE family subunit [Thermoleophilaceae bacterium]